MACRVATCTDDTVQCLSKKGKSALESELERFTSSGILYPGVQNAGRRPGSSVAFLKEQRVGHANGGRWLRTFYCEDWDGPTRDAHGVPRWQIKYDQATSACYVQRNGF